MGTKTIIFEEEARGKLKAGVDTLANAVKVTLGAKGRNVVLSRKFHPPRITKDGVSVAREIDLEDPLENVGAGLVKNVAQKTASDAGDGTTTATILAQSIFGEGLKHIVAGANPMDLKRGIDLATSYIVEELKSKAQPVNGDMNKIRQIATISANNDEELGGIIAESIEKVTTKGVITLEESSSVETYIDIHDGVQFDRGYISKHFVTDQEEDHCKLEGNVFVLITDQKLTSGADLKGVLEYVSKQRGHLLIIAEEVEGRALETLVINKLNGAISVVAVKAPAFGDRRSETLEDFAIMTGATVVSKSRGLDTKDIKIEHLGKCEKVTVTREDTIFIGGAGSPEAKDKRVKQLQKELEKTQGAYYIEKLEERIARFIGGVGVLYVGAASEVEMKERKDRIEDALYATKAAIAEGIVIGGGMALMDCLPVFDKINPENEDQDKGLGIVKQAIQAPFRQIIVNSGLNPDVVLAKIEADKKATGWNAKTGKTADLEAEGVIDPAKVTRVALENAASIAGLLLTTECIVSDKEMDEEAIDLRDKFSNKF